MKFLKILCFLTFLIISTNIKAQTFVYSYTDPCTGLLKSINVPSDGVTVTYFGQIQTFNNSDFENGVFDSWASEVYNSYGNSNPCGSVIGVSTSVDIAQGTALNFINVINSISALSDLQQSMAGPGGSLNTMSAIESAKSSSNKKDKKDKNKSNNTNNSSQTTDGGSQNSGQNDQNQNSSQSNTTNSSQSGEQSGNQSTQNSSGTNGGSNGGSNGSNGGSNSGTNGGSNGQNTNSSTSEGNGQTGEQNTTSQTNSSTGQTGNENSNQTNSQSQNNESSNNLSGGQNNNSGSNQQSTNQSNQQSESTTSTGSGQSGSQNSQTNNQTNNTQNGESQNSQSNTTQNNSQNSEGSQNSGQSSEQQSETGSNNGENSGQTTEGGQNGSTGQNGSGGNGNGSGTNESNSQVPGNENAAQNTEDKKTNFLGGTVNSTQRSTEANKPQIILSSDFAGFNFKNNDVSFGGKGTAGYSAMSWDGRRSYGVLLDYTSVIRGPNITGFYANIAKKRIDLISLTGTFSFYGRGSQYASLAVGQMWNLNKSKSLKAIYLATASFGNVYGEKFLGTAFIAGGMYDWKVSKRIDVKMMNLFIYAPYVSYYNDILLKSPYVIMPIIGTNIGITKKFKFNVNFGGAYAIKQNVMNFTLMFGTRFAI